MSSAARAPRDGRIHARYILVLFDGIVLRVEHIAYSSSSASLRVSPAVGSDVSSLDDELRKQGNDTGVSSFTLSLVVSFIDEIFAEHVRESMHGPPPRHGECTLISLSEHGEPAVRMGDGDQVSGSFTLSASACSRSVWRVSMADASSSNSRFAPRPAVLQLQTTKKLNAED
jgi:hypothetical protein